jgi:hypothetical protein
MEGREGWRVMEGRGSDGGGGNGGAGPSLSTVGTCRPGVGGHRRLWALAVHWWGVMVSVGTHCSVVRGRWVVVCGRRVVVSGRWAHSRVVHVRRWGAIDREQVVRGRLRFVGGGLLCLWVVAALFMGAGLPFVGAELLSVGGRAHSHAVHVHGWVVRGLLFVGAVVPCRVLSPLARSDGMKRTWCSP